MVLLLVSPRPFTYTNSYWLTQVRHVLIGCVKISYGFISIYPKFVKSICDLMKFNQLRSLVLTKVFNFFVAKRQKYVAFLMCFVCLLCCVSKKKTVHVPCTHAQRPLTCKANSKCVCAYHDKNLIILCFNIINEIHQRKSLQ